MTESEAGERLKKNAYRTTCYGNRVVEHEENLIAIQALEEIQQYREVGTVDECREARGKQTARKPIFHMCFACGNSLLPFEGEYCNRCGQRLDWSDEK